MIKIILLSLFVVVAKAQQSDMSCDQFSSIMDDVRSSIHWENNRNKHLEKDGFVKADDVFGAAPTYETCSIGTGNNAKLHTAGAQEFVEKHQFTVDKYDSKADECKYFEKPTPGCPAALNSDRKYRPIDGRGNNVNNPDFGASDTLFARFAEQNYEDGIYTIKKSVTGEDLPNPRELVPNVLTRGVRAAPPPLSYGVFALLTVLFITHDVHYQTQVQPSNVQQEIQCCTADGSEVLKSHDLNDACLPIEISSNDKFYQGNIGCINMVRSQTAEYTNQAQSGNHQSELDPIRFGQGGLFRMGKNNVLPVDSKGNYIPSMRRFTTAPMASIWPSLFARNHNTLAQGLAKLNPQWDDETLFQEARRINIATFQYNLITSKAVEASISNIPINENYSADRNAATSLEFAIVYRMAHYYIHDNMLFQDENLNNKTVLQSDTIGKIELLENDFDGALRGALAEVVKVDHTVTRIGKNSKGFGSDIISIDIQRARDQGLPSFLDVRRQCNLGPEIKTFDDLKAFLNPINVELLKEAYESVEDIDYYVGGILETYEILGNPLVGKTFGCVIAKQWDNFAGGDIYYYTNPSSPYPFTQTQIDSIKKYSISNLLCANSKMTQTAQVWPYAPSSVNPLVSCATFPPMDLTPWKV